MSGRAKDLSQRVVRMLRCSICQSLLMRKEICVDEIEDTEPRSNLELFHESSL